LSNNRPHEQTENQTTSDPGDTSNEATPARSETAAARYRGLRYVITTLPADVTPGLDEGEGYWLARGTERGTPSSRSLSRLRQYRDLRLLLFVWDSLVDEPQEGTEASPGAEPR